MTFRAVGAYVNVAWEERERENKAREGHKKLDKLAAQTQYMRQCLPYEFHSNPTDNIKESFLNCLTYCFHV